MDASDLPSGLRLTELGERRVAVENLGDAGVRDVVFGGQLLAQSVIFAHQLHPGRSVRTLYSVFARSARVSARTELVAEPLHGGRSLAAETITAMQGDRLCCRSLVMLDTGDEDLIAHAAAAPDLGPPERAPEGQGFMAYPGTEVRVVDGVDTWSVDAPTGPPALQVWLRWTRGEATGALGQALLAYATDGFFIGAAMRPHAGIGQDLSHQDISTGVLAHSMTFHAPVSAHEWLLVAFESPYAGAGRSHGRGQVFDQRGGLIASITQDNLIRRLPESHTANRVRTM
ncbi:MAG TPA: thioesterase family protein [Mycobacteriales bacterium]|jgi:acyl-CoA thioesterase II|nr:thioesterase family protein [Mycobacteriales bacterium]